MKINILPYKIIFTVIAVMFSAPLWSATQAEQDKNWFISDPVFWLLIAVIAILFYVMYALAEVLIWSAKKKMGDHKKPPTTLVMVLAIISSIFIPTDVAAQAIPAVAEATKNQLWSSEYLPLFILIAIQVSVITYLTLMLVQLTKKEKQQIYVKYESKLTRLWNKWNYKVPIEREDETILHDHEYDGIQELDNGMPPWLQYIFIFTIGFAIFYMWHYHLGKGLTQEEEYVKSLEKAKIELAAYLENAASNYDENTVVLSTDPSVLSAGKNTYTQFCATCHGNSGEGGVGPNFADDYWINGGSINQVFHTVSEGVPAKGMASWKEILSAKQMFEVSNYIKSLRGTNPPNQKEAQGNLYIEKANLPSDSTTAPLDTISKVDSLKVAIN